MGMEREWKRKGKGDEGRGMEFRGDLGRKTGRRNGKG